MSTLIPKHRNTSPIWERYSAKQYVTPTTGILIVDDAVEKTKQQQSLRSRQRRRGTASKIGAASPGAQKQAIMERQRKFKEAGYYTGKIDGIWGKKSKAALAAYDRDNGKREETMFQTAKRSLLNARNMLPTLKDANEKKGSFMFNLAQSLSNAENPANNLPEALTAQSATFLDNLYPYGYSDNVGRDTEEGVYSKVKHGFLGKSDAKNTADEFVVLDLSDPKQLKRAKELLKYLPNMKSWTPQKAQSVLRARMDANDLYLGRNLRFGTWTINPDYQSPSAIAAGVPTYTYADPALRKQMLEEAATYGRQHGVGIHGVQGDPTTTFNRYTINTMHDDGSGRWGDKWDFAGADLPGSHTIIIGDTIPATLTHRVPSMRPLNPEVNKAISDLTDRPWYEHLWKVITAE